jgi:hypothetical protein
MKAILLAGVTSIQSFPVRTTGPKESEARKTSRAYKIFYTLDDISGRVRLNKRTFGFYLRLTFVRIDNGDSTALST